MRPTRFTAWLLFTLCMLFSAPFITQAQEGSYLERTLKEFDASFLKAKAEKEKKYTQEMEKLKKEQQEVSNQIDILQNRIKEVSKNIMVMDVASGIAKGVSYFSNIFVIFFVIMIINLVIYLAIREEYIWSKFRIWIIILASLLILLGVAPALAQTPAPAASLPENLVRLQQLLDLEKKPVEKGIFLLEQGEALRREGIDTVHMPDFPTWSAPFRPLAMVRLAFPMERHYSLLALYLEKGQWVQAVGALRAICDLPPGGLRPEYEVLWQNLLKLCLDQENFRSEAPLAAEAYARFLEAKNNHRGLAGLAETLAGRGLTDLALKVARETVRVAYEAPVLLRLAQVALPLDPALAREALAKAMQRARSMAELLPVARLVLEKRLEEELAKKAATRLARLGQNPAELLKAAELFLGLNRVDLVRLLLQEAVSARVVSETYLELVQWCIQKRLYDVAFEVIWTMLKENPAAAQKLSVAPDLLAAGAQDTPPSLVPDKIRLGVFLGLLANAAGRRDQAEGLVSAGVDAEVALFLRRAGLGVPLNLNHLFYLKNIWLSLGKESELEKLLPVYRFFQEAYLARLEESHRRDLAQAKERLEALKAAQQAGIEELARLTRKTPPFSFGLLLSWLQWLAVVLTFLLILAGCSLKAWYYAHTVATYRTFAFIGKFLESFGWVGVFSVILALPGATTIFVAQWSQIFQRQQQQVAALAGGEGVAAGPPEGAPPA